MKKLTEKQKEEIINKIKEDKIIPDEYRFLIPFETEREYELVYAGKEREQDILQDTLSVPFQPIKKFGKVKENEWHNMLIFGENLQALKYLLKLKEQGKLRNPDGRCGVKLVYIDPPFGTQQEFRGSKGEKAYQDKIAGAEFLEFLRKRLIFLRELLTEDGSIYVHLDYRKMHYIKILMDEIFGEQNFRNEIIWFYPDTPGRTEKDFNSKHDNILRYAKKTDYIFNADEVREEILPASVERYKKPRILGGREYVGGKSAEIGKVPEDVWRLPAVKGTTEERTEYFTQKPEKLLERIIKASSNPGDIVLDCFAGSGTTGAVAEKLGRKWIMIDSSKLAIYTIQKRMLNLKKEIGNRGPKLTPKPFVLYNAGLYLDSGFIEKMDEADYRKFVLELFGAEPADNKIKGVQMHGILNNRPVMVFSQKDFLTYEFIDDLHKNIGSGLKDEMYIIAPQSIVRFNEDYVQKGKIRYYILRVPYSIIQKIQDKGYIRGLQPFSKDKINQTIESVGFDFIYPPKVECEYYQGKATGQLEIGKSSDQLVVKIKKFEPVQISKKPVEFEDLKKEALAMVMIDENYDGEVFDMDHYFFGDEIVKNDFKVIFPKEKAGPKIMIIYLDVLGNEKIEIKDIKDFKKKQYAGRK